MLVGLAQSVDGVVAVVDRLSFHENDTRLKSSTRTPHDISS